ncbi:MAG: hypothetical protein ACLSAH_17800 [Bilophila wadsworthia]
MCLAARSQTRERLPAEMAFFAKRLRRTSPDWRKRRGPGLGPGTNVRLFDATQERTDLGFLHRRLLVGIDGADLVTLFW